MFARRSKARCMPECRSSTSLYCVLGVSITAPQESIRNAYIELAKRYHPDRHMGDENAKREFQRVLAAYQVLRDEQSRHLYDLNLLDQLDVEDYLSRYQGFILTVSGLGMTSQTLEAANDDPRCLLTAA